MPSCFEIRSLFDVQFDKLMKAALRHDDGFKRAGEAGLRAQFIETVAVFIAQGKRLLRREHVGHHAAAQAADAEAGRLLGGEDDQLDRSPRLEAKFLQDANRFQAAEHADASVVQAGIGNGVDVRARADGRKLGIAALPARKRVADCVLRARSSPALSHRPLT